MLVKRIESFRNAKKFKILSIDDHAGGSIFEVGVIFVRALYGYFAMTVERQLKLATAMSYF